MRDQDYKGQDYDVKTKKGQDYEESLLYGVKTA